MTLKLEWAECYPRLPNVSMFLREARVRLRACSRAATEAELFKRRSLNLAGTRALRKQSLDGLGGFGAAFLLQFVNPIGHSLNHFTRGLSRRVLLGDGLLLTPSLVLLDDFDSFLF